MRAQIASGVTWGETAVQEIERLGKSKYIMVEGYPMAHYLLDLACHRRAI